MATRLSSTVLWMVVLAASVGTFALRLSFIHLFGRLDDIPPRVERPLRFVPAAVLAALTVPGVVAPEGTLALSVGNARLYAGLLAAVVAWRTENMVATIAVGLVGVWLFGSVV